ncbi:C6 zinc finger domain protein [Aspergillus luchuensis]|uniref:C6 zinc finger domain protein n=1 Tax=Aspergillus kawachii TaxID=1069201 RepID=A0A146FK72_ASPKA|nr:C6 zinc finger domain protein [Aspergillus luchuensis]
MRLAGPGLSSVTTVSQVTRRRRRGGGRCGRKGERVDEEQEYTVQISRVKEDENAIETAGKFSVQTPSINLPINRPDVSVGREGSSNSSSNSSSRVSLSTGPGSVPTPAAAQTALE